MFKYVTTCMIVIKDFVAKMLLVLKIRRFISLICADDQKYEKRKNAITQVE